MSLRDFIAKYSAVANDNGTDKDTTHSYGPLYETLFSPVTHRSRAGEDVRILEIGIYSGAFQQVLAEFIPNATIVGADITLANVKFGCSEKNVTMYQLDCTDPSAVTVLQARGPYDIILDDASHHPDHQVITFNLFAPLIGPNGIYIIEDIHQNHADNVRYRLTELAEKHSFVLEWKDLRSIKGRFDDIVAVLRRK
jgi:2-polyprenyl-3-methyl-5-hydroxy-6-metoxy-1,4-benzoquinol methylase